MERIEAGSEIATAAGATLTYEPKNQNHQDLELNLI